MKPGTPVTSPVSPSVNQLLAWLKKSGIDLKSEATIAYGAPPLLAAKTLSGEMDATLNYWNFCAGLEAKGFRRIAGIAEDITDRRKAEIQRRGSVSTVTLLVAGLLIYCSVCCSGFGKPSLPRSLGVNLGRMVSESIPALARRARAVKLNGM